MTLTKAQQQAAHALNDAIVEQITAVVSQHAGDLRKVGIMLSEFTLDLFVVPCEEPASTAQSDADWLKSLRIAPDLGVPHDSQ
jgi:hypothetical protein